jgi:cell division septation protein DedD
MRKKNTKKVTLDKKPFIVLTRRRIGVWACILFLVCAWMFGLGIWVGRGTAPLKFDIDKLEKKLRASRAEIQRRDKRPAPKGSGVAKDKTSLEFYEALKDNRADARISDFKMPPVVSKKIEPSSEKPAVTIRKKTVVEKPKTVKPVAKTKAATTAATVKPDPAPKEQPAAPKTGKSPAASKTQPNGGIYTIQVASVKAANDADRMVAKLKKRGYPAYRAIAKIPGKGIWFRVRIGEFKARNEAGPTMTKLNKEGIKPILVRK